MKIPTGLDQSLLNRQDRLRRVQEDKPFRGGFASQVVATDGDNERVSLSSFVGTDEVSIPFAFMSENAWIRGQPEIGTNLISVIGADSFRQRALAFSNLDNAKSAEIYRSTAQALRENANAVVTPIRVYRSLIPGEVNLGSGLAQTHYGTNNSTEHVSGLTHRYDSNIESVVETPLFAIRGHAHRVGTTEDSLLFGTVRRPTAASAIPRLVKMPAVNTRDATSPVFAKELTVSLRGTGSPGLLIDHRQGDVVDDQGALMHDSFNELLRARFSWFTQADATTAEVDVKGNISLTTAIDATRGMRVNVRSGAFTLSALNDISVASKLGNIDIASGARSKTTIYGGTSGLSLRTLGNFSIDVAGLSDWNSAGVITIDTPVAQGVRIGKGIRHPALVANPVYLQAQGAWLGVEVTFDAMLGSYLQAAAAAWSAVGPLLAALDPTNTVSQLCLIAASAATSAAVSSVTAGSALTTFIPTLGLMPAGYISNKLVSE